MGRTRYTFTRRLYRKCRETFSVEESPSFFCSGSVLYLTLFLRLGPVQCGFLAMGSPTLQSCRGCFGGASAPMMKKSRVFLRSLPAFVFRRLSEPASRVSGKPVNLALACSKHSCANLTTSLSRSRLTQFVVWDRRDFYGHVDPVHQRSTQPRPVSVD